MLNVRPFQSHEWQLYRELRLAALREAPDAFGSTLERELAFPDEQWMTRLATGSASPIDAPFVAEYDGRAVGLCWVRIDPNDAATAALYQVWVHPDARRRGIGQRLLESAMRWARDAGARVMVLSVSIGRASAMDLYRRAGFVAVGLPSQLRPGSALLQQHMQCSLAETTHPRRMHIADPRQVPSGIFLYTLRPTRLAMLTEGPTPEEQGLAARHWIYSQELLAGGVIVFGGRTLNRDADSAAYVVIRAASLVEAQALVDADPSVAGGVFSAQVFPFQPMLMGSWPTESATVASSGGR